MADRALWRITYRVDRRELAAGGGDSVFSAALRFLLAAFFLAGAGAGAWAEAVRLLARAARELMDDTSDLTVFLQQLGIFVVVWKAGRVVVRLRVSNYS